MRIVALLILISITQTFAFDTYAQNKQLSLNVKNETIVNILEKLEDQSEFYFMFDASRINVDQRKSVDCENQSIRNILDQLFEDTGITYSIKDRQVLLTTEKSDIEQQKSVTGKVTGENGESLPGVTVVIKGTTQGTITGADGQYSLSNVPPNATLVFSFVGMKSQEIPVGGKNSIDVKLVEETIGIEEVVAIGYGTQRKADLISAVTSMDAERLNERPINKVDQALIGQMSGVRVQQTGGLPGKEFSIQVRGTGSISANNEPLYVIDGFPMEISGQASNGSFSSGNPLTNLNPNDIESIQVLKDAAAASIYGSRGANGVVIITTKRGKLGKPQISFNTYMGWSEVTKKLDVLSSEEWIDRQIEHMNYFWVRDHKNDLGATSSQTNEERRSLLGLSSGEYNTKYMWDERWLEPGHPGLDFVDWQDLLFRKGLVQSYQLSATGGTDVVKYYISSDYLDQDGVSIGVKYKRYSGRANVEVAPNENLRFGLNLTPSYSEEHDPGSEGKDAIAMGAYSHTPVVESSSGAEGYNVGENTRYIWGVSRPSAIAEAKMAYGKSQTWRTIATGFVEYELLDGLVAKTSLNFDVHNNETSRFTPAIVRSNRTASGSRSGYNRSNFVNENTINYNKTIKEKHTVDIIGGYSYSSFKIGTYSISGTGFASDKIYTLNAASSTSGSSNETENILISYFGRAQYSFKDKYLVQTSIRRDGSSKFGNNTKWGVFPSMSVGWRVSEEDFMKSVSLFDNLKLRTSWGLAGNNGIGDYAHIARLAFSNYSNNGSLINGMVPSNFANPDLGWETSETFDIGVDFSILSNRISSTFDYYTKRNTDLLLNIPVPTASGFSKALTNIGEVMNKGWEFEVNTRNMIGEFKWQTMVNLSYNTNEVKKLGPNNTPILGGAFDITHNILEVGKPMYTIYVVQQDGLLTTEDIQNGVARYGNQEAGDPKYVDQNNDGKIDANDRTYSGHPNPDYVWGITNSFSYKGFDLSVLMQGQMGGVIYSTFGRAMYRTGQGSGENMLAVGRNRVIWEEDKVYTKEDVAGKARKSPSSFGRIKNTDWLYANDYWRVRNITLGYDLGKHLRSNVITDARIYITAENWFGGDKYEGGVNPEAVNNSGDDYGGYPLSKSMVFGINLKF